MIFKYKYEGVNWTVDVTKESSYYFTWNANSDWGYLADREGGELGDMQNAKATIKEWIRRFMDNPIYFKMNEPYLTVRRY